MFGSLGVPELIFIFALALLIFGPRKLPEIGRTLGRGLSEFRKASTELKRSINTEMIEEEIRQSDPRKILDDSPAASPEAGADDTDAKESPPATADEPSGDAPPEGSVPRSEDSHSSSSGGTPATEDAGRTSGTTEAS